MKIAFALAAIFVSLPVAAQVYKCKDASGTTVFSSQPCGSDAQSIDVRPASGKGGPVDEAAAISNRWIATGRVGPGMTAAQVRASWGSPHKINQTFYSSGAVEQWIYYRDANHIRAQYVHFRNGVVSSVSD